MKKCNTCEQLLPLTAFHRRKASSDGLSPRCKQCVREAFLKHWEANRERFREKRKAAYHANREESIAKAREWNEANKERAREAARKYRKAHYQANKAAYMAHAKARKLLVANRVPLWADMAAIKAVYAEAEDIRSLGVEVEVDHIIPLHGKTVSGLHVHNNLQLMLGPDNRAKSNRFDGGEQW